MSIPKAIVDIQDRLDIYKHSQLTIDIVEVVYVDIEEWSEEERSAYCYYLVNLLEVIKEGPDKELIKDILEALRSLDEE